MTGSDEDKAREQKFKELEARCKDGSLRAELLAKLRSERPALTEEQIEAELGLVDATFGI